jgi:dTDP-4-dehydrorhamnose reductase
MIGRGFARLVEVFKVAMFQVRERGIMRVLLTGASGQLGSYLIECLTGAGHEVIPWSASTAGKRAGLPLRRVDLTDEQAVKEGLRDADPEVIIHTAAMSAPEEVRKDPARGHAVNVEGTGRLARWCRELDRRLVFTSTDMVFDGSRSWYCEKDDPHPILAYGRTKREAEPLVLAVPLGLVARISLLYGPSRLGRDTYFDRSVAALRAGRPQVFFDDEFRTPLAYATAARILVQLAYSDAVGIVHVAGRERVSRFELMKRVATTLEIDPNLVRSHSMQDIALAETRPADVSLDTTLLNELLPGLDRPSIEDEILTA